MDKTAGTMIREFEEERTMTDRELVLQVREMFEESKKENDRLREMLHKQTLMHEDVRKGIDGLIKKIGNTVMPCEYNDAIVDMINLFDEVERKHGFKYML